MNRRTALTHVVEVPGGGGDRARVADRAELGHERGCVGGRGLTDRGGELGLALDVRRQPHAAAERPQPGPGQPRAQLVADLAALLGDAEDEHQPAAVPLPRLSPNE